jgi:DNA repair protein SbcC/Rad50
MPNSQPSPLIGEAIRRYLQQLSQANSAEFVSGDNATLLIFKTFHHLVAFAFASNDADATYEKSYGFFKTLYRTHQAEWDKLDTGYVLCVSPDTNDLYELMSRIESDTYFCRKFVVALTEQISDSLAQLPFLPLVTPEGPSLRPPSAQTFLHNCGVGAPLARDIVVQHARSPIGIVDDCVEGKHARSKLSRTRTRVEIQTDASVQPVRLAQITIKNFRAYRRAQTFNIGRDITILYGPNGFGKTSFFDAIDFAVTGSIGRLERSNEAQFSKLAAHLDASDKEDAFVTLRFSDSDTLHSVIRTISEPKLATLDEALEPRDVVLRRLTVGGAVVADRVDNLISLFRATHLFSQGGQELTKDFSEKSTLSSRIVSRLLAFEDYANAVKKSSDVAELLKARLAERENDITKANAELKAARNALNQLKRTTTTFKTPGALNAEIEALRRTLSDLHFNIPKGRGAEALTIRGWRAALESRLADVAATKDRFDALAQEVARLPEMVMEVASVQQRLSELEVSRRAANERRVVAAQAQQAADNRLKELVPRLQGAQQQVESLRWLRATKGAYDALVQEERSAALELDAASKKYLSAKAEESRLVAQLEPKLTTARMGAERLEEIQTRLGVIIQLRTNLPQWATAVARLPEVRRQVGEARASLAALHSKGTELKQQVDANAAKQQQLTHVIQSVDHNQTEVKQLLSRLQQHLAGDGVCPLCGQDHGSSDRLIARINRQLSQDAASETRAELAAARQLGQTYAKELAGNESTLQETQGRVSALDGEAITLTEQIDRDALTATSLGFAVGSSFPDLAKAIELQQSAISEELARENENNRAMAVEVDNALKGKNAASSAAALAAAREGSLKQRLDDIRRRLDTLRGDSRASTVKFNVPLSELTLLESDTANALERARAAYAAATEGRSAAPSLIDAASKEETKARSDQVPLRTRLAELERDRASIVGQLKDAELPEDATASDVNAQIEKTAASQAHLRSLQARLSGVEVGLDAATTAAALNQLRENVEKTKRQLGTLKSQSSGLKPWHSYFATIRRLLSSEQQEAVNNFLQQYGPRTSIIQRRLRAVYGFDNIKIASSRSDIRVTVERNGEDVRPIDYFSESQKQTLLLGLFLTACSSQNWSSFSPILLDDPVTHFDDLNTYALLDLILGLLRSDMGRRQFIISTCDEKLLQLAQQKFEHLGDAAIFYRFLSFSENGSEVERIH